MMYHKGEFVLGYHVPNKHKDPEAYAHHLLFMFIPFAVKNNLKQENHTRTAQKY